MIGLPLILAAAAAQTVAAPAARPDYAVAEIEQLERQWGEAFVKRDFDFLERIVAPEYRLVVAFPDGKYDITRRADWMKNAKAFIHKTFTVETVDVNRAGDTAVASAQGVWTVARRQGEEPRPIRFFVTDTWVKRAGKWQVIHRYSHRLANASSAPTPR